MSNDYWNRPNSDPQQPDQQSGATNDWANAGHSSNEPHASEAQANLNQPEQGSQPIYGEQPYGSSNFSQQGGSTESQSSYGSSFDGGSTDQNWTNNQPGPTASQGASNYSQNSFGANSYGDSSYGTNGYPSTGYSHETPTGSEYGQSGYGSGGYANTYGSSSSYGSSSADSSASYGQANYGQEANTSNTYRQASYGAAGYGQNSYDPASGGNGQTGYGSAGYDQSNYGGSGYDQSAQYYGGASYDQNFQGYGYADPNTNQGYPYGSDQQGAYGQQNYSQSLYGPVAGAGAYAPWSKRALAGLIDYVAPSLAVGLITGPLQDNDSTLATVISIVVYLAYFGFTIYNTAYLGGTTGQSYGRKAAKTRLVSAQTGQPIGFGMAFVRHLAHLIDSVICYVGWLFPLWDENRQTIADKMMSTIVIEDQEQPTQPTQQPQGYQPM